MVAVVLYSNNLSLLLFSFALTKSSMSVHSPMLTLIMINEFINPVFPSTRVSFRVNNDFIHVLFVSHGMLIYCLLLSYNFIMNVSKVRGVEWFETHPVRTNSVNIVSHKVFFIFFEREVERR